MRGALPARAAPFLAPHVPALLVALAAALALLWRAARARDLPRAALLAGALLALTANAVATGALSKPHDRYQARIAWLLPLAVLTASLPGLAPQAAKRPRAPDDLRAG
jgi:peptidoglycan/LPS O-acetylase OafA/YrhL